MFSGQRATSASRTASKRRRTPFVCFGDAYRSPSRSLNACVQVFLLECPFWHAQAGARTPGSTSCSMYITRAGGPTMLHTRTVRSDIQTRPMGQQKDTGRTAEMSEPLFFHDTYQVDRRVGPYRFPSRQKLYYKAIDIHRYVPTGRFTWARRIEGSSTG